MKVRSVNPVTQITPAWDEANILILEGVLPSLLAAQKRSRLTRSYLINQLPRANSVEKTLKRLTLKH